MKEIIKKIAKNFLLCTTLYLAAAGCAPTAKVAPFDIKDATSTRLCRGVVFSLPKTVLQATIVYSEIKEITKHSAPGKSVTTSEKTIVTISKTPRLELVTIVDPRMVFLLDTDSLNGFFYDSNLTVQNTAEGLFKSINLTAEDKTPEVIANIAQTALQLAKAAAVAGKKDVTYKPVRDVTVVRTIDPASIKFEKTGDNLYCGVYSDQGKIASNFSNLDQTDLPDLTISFASPSDLQTMSLMTANKIMPSDAPGSRLPGIPYRIPQAVEIMVKYNDPMHGCIYTTSCGFYSFAQAGGVACAPVKGKFFSKTTTGLTMYDKECSLKEYISSGTSPAEKISKTANEISADAAKQLQELYTLEMDMRIARLKKQKQILDAENDLSDANPDSIKSRTERLKQIKALLDAALAAEEAASKK